RRPRATKSKTRAQWKSGPVAMSSPLRAGHSPSSNSNPKIDSPSQSSKRTPKIRQRLHSTTESMKTELTPGPWEAKRDPAHYDTLSTVVGGEDRPNSNGQPNRRLIVQVGGFADWREQEANARLIAASPD